MWILKRSSSSSSNINVVCFDTAREIKINEWADMRHRNIHNLEDLFSPTDLNKNFSRNGIEQFSSTAWSDFLTNCKLRAEFQHTNKLCNDSADHVVDQVWQLVCTADFGSNAHAHTPGVAIISNACTAFEGERYFIHNKCPTTRQQNWTYLPPGVKRESGTLVGAGQTWLAVIHIVNDQLLQKKITHARELKPYNEHR